MELGNPCKCFSTSDGALKSVFGRRVTRSLEPGKKFKGHRLQNVIFVESIGDDNSFTSTPTPSIRHCFEWLDIQDII